MTSRKDMPIAALYSHCVLIYDKMLESSTPIYENDEFKMIQYEGFLTKLVASAGLSTPYYSFCTKALKEMGCIRSIQRGAHGWPSKWELITEPTEALFNKAKPAGSREDRLGRKSEVTMLKAQIAAINKRLLEVEDKLK